MFSLPLSDPLPLQGKRPPLSCPRTKPQPENVTLRFRLHPLKGDRAGQWSVRVSGNWRVVFRFVDGEAVGVDLLDYH